MVDFKAASVAAKIADQATKVVMDKLNKGWKWDKTTLAPEISRIAYRILTSKEGSPSDAN